METKQPKKLIEFDIINEHEEIIDKKNIEPILINKGTGAGGTNTNYYGKHFEDKTNNQTRLLNDGYIKHSFVYKKQTNAYGYYLSKTFEDKKIVFVLQNGLKKYMKSTYNIDAFRCPDEAYIIEYSSGRKVITLGYLKLIDRLP